MVDETRSINRGSTITGAVSSVDDISAENESVPEEAYPYSVTHYVGDQPALLKIEKPKKDNRTETIGSLAKQLKRYALSDSLEDFHAAENILIATDSQLVAQALHHIPSDALVAKLLCSLKEERPEIYNEIAFYLDFYNPPGVFNRRDRVETLIGSISVSGFLADNERTKKHAKARVLGLIGIMAPDNDWKKLRNAVGRSYGDLTVKGLITGYGNTSHQPSLQQISVRVGFLSDEMVKSLEESLKPIADEIIRNILVR